MLHISRWAVRLASLLLTAAVAAVPASAALTSTSIVAAPNPATYGSPVTLTATVSPAGATGKVTFFDGAVPIGIAPVSEGTAVLVTRMLPSGVRSLRAVYQGDPTYAISTSAPFEETVKTVAAKAFLSPLPLAGTSSMAQALVGDFNEDGKPDLAGIFRLDYTVKIFLGVGDGTFAAPLSSPAGTPPWAFAASDFDGDGHLDLAVANHVSLSLAVLIGHGDGTFAAPVLYVPPGSAGTYLESSWVTPADFNTDGNIDLAVGSSGDDAGILLGNGDGTFVAGREFDAGKLGAFAADVNHDGATDLISYGSGVSVLLGTGDGSFSYGPYTSPPFPWQTNTQIVAGDFNADGEIDLASPAVAVPRIALGIGDGTFVWAPELSLTRPSHSTIIVAEDFNGDEKLDLVSGGYEAILDTLLGIGQGSLQPAYQRPLQSAYPSILLGGDFNLDGRADVAVIGNAAPGVFLGAPETGLKLTKTHTGDFALGVPASYTLTVENVGPEAVSETLTVSDILPPSLIPSSIGGAGWTCTLVPLQCETTTFLASGASAPPITLTANLSIAAPPVIGNQASVAMGDPFMPVEWANDVAVVLPSQTIQFPPLPDRHVGESPFQLFAATSSGLPVNFSASGSCNVQAPSTVTLSGTGSCTITASQPGDATYPPAANVIQDFTVFGSSTAISLGSFANPSLFGAPVTLTATVTPANATGTVAFYDGVEILGTGTVSGGVATLSPQLHSTGVRKLRARYSGDFGHPGSVSPVLEQLVRSLPVTSLRSRAPAPFGNVGRSVASDFDGNGKVDVASMVGNMSSIFLNDGLGNLVPQPSVVTPAGYFLGCYELWTGDFDRDGRPDLAACSQGGLLILRGDGDGTFTPQQLNTAFPSSFSTADFNGDGRLDIAFVTPGALVGILLGDGLGGMGTLREFPSGVASPQAVRAGDFNGDGNADLGIVNLNLPMGSVHILLGNGNGTFQPSMEFPAGEAPLNFATGDLNGDGKQDIVVAGGGGYGQLNVVLGNGDGTFQAPVAYETEPYILQATIVDVNGDGNSDVVIAEGGISHQEMFGVFLGNGNGTLNDAVEYTGTNVHSVVAADLNGDARVDLAGTGPRFEVLYGDSPHSAGIFRGGFFWLEDVDGDGAFHASPDRAFAFGGVPGDIPISGDWNGSGTTKVGVYRPSNGLFVLDYDGDGQFTAADKAYNLGVGTEAGDVPVVGDWNGDRKTKVGLFRQGYFWILDTNGNGVFEQSTDQTAAFGGVAGDLPVVGDWNGDGTSKLGLFRQGFFWILDANGNGTLDNVNQESGDRAFAFGGLEGDVPLAGDWNGEGPDKAGIFRAGFFWVLDANGNTQFDGTGPGQDLAFPFGGLPGDKPVVGTW